MFSRNTTEYLSNLKTLQIRVQVLLPSSRVVLVQNYVFTIYFFCLFTAFQPNTEQLAGFVWGFSLGLKDKKFHLQ